MIFFSRFIAPGRAMGLGLILLSGLSDALAQDQLIPAAFGIRKDREGNSWNVEPNGNIGRIGSTMVNSGHELLVNDEKFEGFHPMMSADGSEFVFQGLAIPSLPGLQVQRRVQLLEKSGGLRYAEIFYNGSTDPMNITVGLTTNFSGNYKTFLSDRGRSEPVILSAAETGIIVIPGSSQSTRAFLYTLADAESTVKPTISSLNRYGLTLRYPLELDPGESKVIVHHVTQVVTPRNFDRLTLRNLTRPHSIDEIGDSFSNEWKDYIVNDSAETTESAVTALKRNGIDALGIERGVLDTLAIGAKTRLSGKTEGGILTFKSDYGEGQISLDRVAAVTGNAGNLPNTSRIFLKDGQIFTATVDAPDLAFVQTGGERIKLDLATLDRLVMSKGKDEKDWTSDSLALIETHSGDRIAIRDATAFSLNFATRWGIFPLTLESLAWLKPAPEGAPGHWVGLKNGSECYGFITDATLSIPMTDAGDLLLKPIEIKNIFTPFELNNPSGAQGPQIEAAIRLSGHQTVMGSITNTTIPSLSEGSRLETTISDVRQIRRIADISNSGSGLADDAPTFEIERWDGGILTGPLALEFLSVAVVGGTWELPVREIRQIAMASPLLTPETLSKIESLILKLAAEEWATREEATVNLGAFGYLASPVLQRELGKTKDPEVGRRIERVLADLN